MGKGAGGVLRSGCKLISPGISDFSLLDITRRERICLNRSLISMCCCESIHLLDGGKRRGYIYIRDIYSRGKIRGGEGTKKGRKEWLQVCLFIRTPKNEIVVKIPLPSVTPESLNIYRRGDAAREYLILLFIARLFFFLTLFTFYL